MDWTDSYEALMRATEDNTAWCQYCDELRGESAMRWVEGRYICTVCKPRPPATACRPGMECWQGCPNCRPTYNNILSPNEQRRMVNRGPVPKTHRKVWPDDEIIAFREMTALGGATWGDSTVHVYKQKLNGHDAYGEYRNGQFVREWVA